MTDPFLHLGERVHWRDMSGYVTATRMEGNTYDGVFESRVDVLFWESGVRTFVQRDPSVGYCEAGEGAGSEILKRET